MKTPAVIEALGGLAHEHRLAIYRLLVQRGPDGLPAGVIGQRVGLITQRRESRQLIYSADFAVMNGLVGYLTENCCGNSGSQCCPPALAVKPAKRVSKVA